MASERVVIALGGNALLRRGERADVETQRRHVADAVEAIAEVAAGREVIVTHGNGPQVGLLALQAAAYEDEVPAYPLDVLGAESEGMIGYLLEQELANALGDRSVATLLTQVVVDAGDPAFDAPSKPIGPVYEREPAERLAVERGWAIAAEGGGHRRVVASPEPVALVELAAIRTLVEAGVLLVCAGGGGIPVVCEDGRLRGVEAVVDKDLVAALLARELGADALLLLTDVAAVEAGWGTPQARPLGETTVAELRALDLEPGSMAPKVEAACRFASRRPAAWPRSARSATRPRSCAASGGRGCAERAGSRPRAGRLRAMAGRGALTLILLVAGLALSVPGAAAKQKFPKRFLWGTAIAGFQTEAGKGKHADPHSDWFEWTHDATNIADGTVSGDLPEDGPGHYRRFKGDLKLAAKELHNDAFRFSVEWPRIFPRSTEGIDVGGRVGRKDLERLDDRANRKAVRHYRKVLRAAAKRGLTPFVTLHHWTIPTWLHDPLATRDALAGRDPDAPLPDLERDGWLDDATVDEFEKYAAYLAWKLGDRADYWNTLNEPMVQVANGFVNVPGLVEAYWPPGAFSFSGAITTLTNLEAANTVAYDALKRLDRSDADGDGRDSRVGPVMNMIAFTPADPGSALDVEGTGHADYLFNRLFLNGVVNGDVDADGDGEISAAEAGLHGRKADFVGLNYYFRGRVTGLPSPLTPSIPVLDFLPATSYGSPENPLAPPCPTTCSELGAEIYPEGFRDVINAAAGYGLPIYVTENGIADADDDQRPDYLREHLAQLHAAIREDGVDVRGYFQWSLVDNLEWVYGYQPKFGLYSFDPRTLKRTARPSAGFYARVAKRNALP